MEEFDLKRFTKTALQKKIIIVIIMIMIVSMVLGYFYSYHIIIPEYQSKSKIVLTKAESIDSVETESSIAQSDVTLNNSLVDTYSDIIKSQTIVKAVIDNLGLDISEESLYNKISVESGNTAAILTITVSNEDPKLAMDLTNEIAEVFSEQIKELYGINNVNILDKAEEASTPYNINHQKDFCISFILGLFVSIIFVFIVYMLDTTIKQAEDIEAIGMQTIGIIPIYEKDEENKINQDKEKQKKSSNKKISDSELVVFENAKSPITEAFRTLRTNLAFSNDSKTIKNILITSSNSREGKSYISANLAIMFAKANKKVILVDADMRKGRQNKIFKLSNSQGLSNCLVDMTPRAKMELPQMSKYIKETKIPNLHLMTSGDTPLNSAELLSSARILKLLKLLNSMYDIVIIDGTPSSIISDSLTIAKYVDVVLAIAAYKTTKVESLKEIGKSFENVGGKISGVILNKYPISKSVYTASYYYDNKDKEEKTEVQNTQIRSVSDVIIEAIKKERIKNRFEEIQKTSEHFSGNPESSTENNTENVSNSVYIDNSYIESQIENIIKESDEMKKLFIRCIVENRKEYAKLVNDMKLEINNMKKMLNVRQALDTNQKANEELESLKEMVEQVIENQKENDEKIKRFVQVYRKIIIANRNKKMF
jgi:capsular exopolysaccharide synthesis family protein